MSGSGESDDGYLIDGRFFICLPENPSMNRWVFFIRVIGFLEASLYIVITFGIGFRGYSGEVNSRSGRFI